MSLTGSPDCFFLPDDQEEPTIYPSIEYDEPGVNQFDELLNSTEYDNKSHSSSIKREASDDFELFAAVNACSSSDPGHAKNSPSPQPWRKGLWCLNQKPSTAGLAIGKTRKSNAAPPNIVSPAHLVVNDNYALRSPRSVTQPSKTKSASPVRGTVDMLCSSQQRGFREINLTPSPVHSRYTSTARSDYIDTWQQDFQNFNLLTQPEQPDFSLNLKPQQKFIAVSKPTTVKPRAVTTYHAHGTNSYSKQGQRQPSHELSSILQANLHATSNNLSINPEPAFQFIAEDGQTIADWTSESQHSSSSSHRSCASHQSQRSSSHLYNTLPPQTFWSPPTTHIDTHNVYASREHYPQLIQPRPQRSPYQILKHEPPPLPQQYMAPADEMIGMALTTDGIGVAMPYYPPTQPEYMSPTVSGTSHGYVVAPPQGYTYANQLATYPALPPPLQQTQYFPDHSPFHTPRRSRPDRRTPSPPFSPSTTRMPRSNKTRSPSRPDSTRKKSISRSGPMSDNDTRRHRSASRGPPKTPRTPRSATNNFGAIDFVNFTPKDARKLLSDVAPSGSSKTRARREQEAREKRKKLGEAALHAVKVAGGDIETFQRQVGLVA